MLNDGFNSITRYFYNNFSDGFRQVSTQKSYQVDTDIGFIDQQH